MFNADRAGKQAIVDSDQIGRKYPCRYNPERPEQAILVRRHAWAPYVFRSGFSSNRAISSA
jgi:hypothetical protein